MHTEGQLFMGAVVTDGRDMGGEACGNGAVNCSEVAEALFARQFDLMGKQDSLVAKIACELARDIIEGRTPPGGDLNSLELAKRFDTSRTPVREALMLLKNEGLVEIPPRRRPRAARLSAAIATEIYRLRAELLALVGCKVANIDGGHRELDLALAVMEKAADGADQDAYFWANVQFHDQLATASQDSTLKQTVDGLGLRVLQLRHLSLAIPGRKVRSLEDHKRLMLAIHEKDCGLAGALCKSIVLSALDNVLKHLLVMPAEGPEEGSDVPEEE